jgi:hypothetical protein
MNNITLGEYGQRIIFALSEAARGDITIQLRAPNSALEDVTTYIGTVGEVPVSTGDGIIPAYEYASYTTQDGDINESGIWFGRAIDTEPNRLRVSDWVPFRVVTADSFVYATTPFDDLVVELIPFVPGCPDGMILSEIRSAAIEVCKLTDAYQETLVNISTVQGRGTYSLDLPEETVLEKILTAKLGGIELEPTSFQLLESQTPNRTLSTPTSYLKGDGNNISIFPTPAIGSPEALAVRVVLRPTTTAQVIKASLFDDYKEAILYGALYRLLRHPAKEWGDPNAAREYSALFSIAVADAALKSRQADTGIARNTGYGGVTTKTARRKYGRR